MSANKVNPKQNIWLQGPQSIYNVHLKAFAAAIQQSQHSHSRDRETVQIKLPISSSLFLYKKKIKSKRQLEKIGTTGSWYKIPSLSVYTFNLLYYYKVVSTLLLVKASLKKLLD